MGRQSSYILTSARMKFSTVLVAAFLAFTAFSMVFTHPVETERRLEMADVPGAQSWIQSGGHPEMREDDEDLEDLKDGKDDLEDGKDDKDDVKDNLDDEKDDQDELDDEKDDQDELEDEKDDQEEPDDVKDDQDELDDDEKEDQ